MINLKSQKEIMASWLGDIEKPLVSISCITFNHENYIEDALIGFLRQETTFAFEILIHDDASTDKTAQIIRNYHEAYPRLIKPILQKENQYSKGTKINFTFNVSRAKGEFIALCEGDDYWVDKHKLEKQVSIANKYDCDLVFNPAYVIDYEARDMQPSTAEMYGYYASNIARISFEKILSKSGNAIPASSILFRASALRAFDAKYQSFCSNWLTHFYWQLLGAMRNGAVVIPQFMSVYRRGRPGSWTRDINSNNSAYIKSSLRFIKSLKVFNELTELKYDQEIRRVYSRRLKIFLLSERFSQTEKSGWLFSLKGILPRTLYCQWSILLTLRFLSQKNIKRFRWLKNAFHL